MVERNVKLMVLDKWFKVSRPLFDEIMDFVEGAVEELAAVGRGRGQGSRLR